MPLGGFVEISIESATSQQTGLVVLANVEACQRRCFKGFYGAVGAVDANAELCFGGIHHYRSCFLVYNIYRNNGMNCLTRPDAPAKSSMSAKRWSVALADIELRQMLSYFEKGIKTRCCCAGSSGQRCPERKRVFFVEVFEKLEFVRLASRDV